MLIENQLLNYLKTHVKGTAQKKLELSSLLSLVKNLKQPSSLQQMNIAQIQKWFSRNVQGLTLSWHPNTISELENTLQKILEQDIFRNPNEQSMPNDINEEVKDIAHGKKELFLTPQLCCQTFYVRNQRVPSTQKYIIRLSLEEFKDIEKLEKCICAGLNG